MDISLHIQGRHITFEREHVTLEGSDLRLLADIEKPIVIHENEHARIATPITIGGGNRAVLAIAYVDAGEPNGGADGTRGQFIVPPADGEVVVEVDVINRTGAILTIQPRVGLGTLTFRPIQMAEDVGQASAPTVVDDEDGFLPFDGLQMQAVFRPAHIDAAARPEYGTAGAAAFDLRADVAEAIVLQPGRHAPIATGLSLAIPAGFEGQIRPRSGLAMKHGISVTNSPATIDSDYRGEIKVLLHNLGSEPFTVEPGERIAQMLIAPVARAVLDYVDALDETARGAGGFGSTGTR